MHDDTPMRGCIYSLTMLVLATSLGCVDPNDFLPDEPVSEPPRANRAPVVAQIGAVEAEEGQRVRIVVTAHDLDLDPLSFAADPVPAGAVFDNDTGVFEWFPALGAADRSPYRVTFSVSDGFDVTTVTANIIIYEATFALARAIPSRVPQEGGARVTLEGVGFLAGAEVVVDGLDGVGVEVHSDRRLQFTTPPLSDRFGPVLVTVVLLDGRRTTLFDGLFVYRDEAEAFGANRNFGLDRPALD